MIKEPEPLVLVSDFLPNAVQISAYFWILSKDTSGDKLKSLILEKVKETLLAEGFTLPAATQQLAFAAGIPELGKLHGPMKEKRGEIGKDKPKEEIHSQNAQLLREASKGRDIDHGREIKIDSKKDS